MTGTTDALPPTVPEAGPCPSPSTAVTSSSAGTTRHLLSALRDELDVTSPKDGCSPSGQCGCCTVLIDGKAPGSCRSALAKAAGKSVTTLEGFDADERDRLASAFAATGALQCGFCTPGHRHAHQGAARPDRRPEPATRDKAARRLGAHLCRCTGYVKILDAIETLAADEVPVGIAPGGVGRPRRRSTRRPSSPSATGATSTTSALAGMLHAALAAHRPRPGRHRRHRHRAAGRSRRRRGTPSTPPPTCPASCGSGSSTRTGRS